MSEMEYDDGLIACSDSGLVIRRYSLFLSPKRVPYTRIRAVRTVALRGFRFGMWRIWGSTDLRHRFNLDWRRPWKQVGLVLDVGTRTRPVISPDDPRRVVAALRSHGVAVDER